MMINVNGLQFTIGLNGVLGPRGAGKTRLLQQIVTERANDVRLMKLVLYVTDDLHNFHNFTLTETLAYAAGAAGIAPADVPVHIEAVLTRMHLMRYAHLHVFELTNCLRVQTLLAKALLANPAVLLLDGLLHHLNESECMHIGYLLSKIATDRVVVLAGDVNETVEGLFDTVCLLHPDKTAVHVATNTAYAWVEGKVWEYVAAECPQASEGRMLTVLKQAEDGAVYVREVATQEPCAEVSQVTPTLRDAYLWWAAQREPIL